MSKLPSKPKGFRNIYCDDKEDRVDHHKCANCEKCYIFVESYKGHKNGGCPFGGPFTGTVGSYNERKDSTPTTD